MNGKVIAFAAEMELSPLSTNASLVPLFLLRRSIAHPPLIQFKCNAKVREVDKRWVINLESNNNNIMKVIVIVINL